MSSCIMVVYIFHLFITLAGANIVSINSHGGVLPGTNLMRSRKSAHKRLAEDVLMGTKSTKRLMRSKVKPQAQEPVCKHDTENVVLIDGESKSCGEAQEHCSQIPLAMASQKSSVGDEMFKKCPGTCKIGSARTMQNRAGTVLIFAMAMEICVNAGTPLQRTANSVVRWKHESTFARIGLISAIRGEKALLKSALQKGVKHTSIAWTPILMTRWRIMRIG
jgi:hypothetical protein